MAYCSHDGTSLIGDPDFLDFRSYSELLPGTVLGKYRVIKQLGQGGMAVVYEAEHVQLGRHVAIKVLSMEAEDAADIARRFFAEARAANEVGHENIVEIFDFAVERGHQYCVMELLKGSPLSTVMAARGALPLARTLRIVTQLADALAAVHRAGIVHRDLKPDNIFLTKRAKQRDFVKLLDFGVAKLLDAQWSGFRGKTKTGYIIGTPAYIAPEQMTQKRVDYRADMYAFGVMLFEMTTGRKPFVADNVADLLVMNVHDAPPAPSSFDDLPQPIPEALEALILECLAKQAEERPGSMEEVLERLGRIAIEYGRPDEMSGPRTVEETELLPVTSVRTEAHRSPTAPVSHEDLTLLFQESEVERALEDEPAAAPTAEARVPARLEASADEGGQRRSVDQQDSLPPKVIEAITSDRRVGVGALAIIILVLLGIAAALGLLWQRGPGAEQMSAPGGEQVTIALVSTPAGAQVFREGRGDPIGVTPLRRSFPRSVDPVRLEFRLAGYQTAQRRLLPTGDARLVVVLELLRRVDASVSQWDGGPGRQLARVDAGSTQVQPNGQAPASDGDKTTKKKRRKRRRVSKDEQSGIEGLVDPFSE